MHEMDYTVTLTAKDLAFRERARAAGIPAMVVSMYAGALQRLVDKERTWVGLTDEEIDHAAEQSDNYASFIAGVLFAQDKLEEKNGG